MGASQSPAASQRRIQAWSSDRLREYGVVQPLLPVREESITPLDASQFNVRAAIVAAGDVVLFRVRPDLRSVGISVLDPAYIALVIPVSWEGEYVLNGRAASASTIYPPTADGVFYIRGGRRDTLAVCMPRSSLIETLSALRGVNPDEVILDERPLELHPAGARSLRRSLATVLDAHCSGSSQVTARERADEIFGLIVDAYLSARPEDAPRSLGVERLVPIVRRAEERFADAGDTPISLADLCAAAGVGKNTLYDAFRTVCDAPPLEYFRRRRLVRARSILMATAAPNRGGVKRAALEVGLTELGRFSVEYRRLFGESPSTTLNARMP